jgi:hypothetical protein
MSTDSHSSPSDQLFPWFGYASGMAIAVMVAVVYWVRLHHGQWPLSHPWSGITLSISAVMSATLPRLAAARPEPARRIIGFILSAFVLVSSLYGTVLWMQANLMLD